VDDLSIQQTHSTFLSSLSARGHDVTIRHVYNEENKLGSYGEWYYDNLVLFCPTAEDLGEIKVSTIVSFVDAGKNVLLAVNEHVTEPLRELANELGVDFDQEKTMVIDHVNYDHSLDPEFGGLHTVIFNRPVTHAPVILGGSDVARNILFRGVGHAAQDSPLVIRVLTGSSTAFSADPTKPVQEIQSGGADTLLVSAIQTRGNARVVVSGSLDLFSDRFFFAEVNDGHKKGKSGNQHFGIELSKWNFHERGLVRASQLKHHRVGETQTPSNYRIKDNIDFSVLLEEYDGDVKQWVPFKQNDVQLEFVMLDPYIRKTLRHDGKGRYSLIFRAPDVYGVFKFRINYNRLGYSNLEVAEVVPVHPYRHNEYDRFIPVAYPYYFASFSLMAGFFFFGLVFLSTKDEK